MSYASVTAQQKFVVDRNFGESCGLSQTFFQANQYELIKLSSGKYLVIGDKFGLESAESNEILFARYNSDGTIDTSFASNGIRMFNFDVFTKVTFKYFSGLFCWVGHGQFLQFHCRILVVASI